MLTLFKTTMDNNFKKLVSYIQSKNSYLLENDPSTKDLNERNLWELVVETLKSNVLHQ